MRLVCSEYGIEINIQENKIDVFVVENQQVLANIINSIWKQCEGEDGIFVLSDKDKIYKFNKNVEFVQNPFAVDCNSKKIISKIYKELEDNAMEEFVVERFEINQKIFQFLDSLLETTSYGLECDLEIDLQTLLKLYNVRIGDENMSFAERVLRYMKLMNEVCGTCLFIFYGLRELLEKEEIETLYGECLYNKFNLLLIEGCTINLKYMYEKWYIFDRDRCIIEPE